MKNQPFHRRFRYAVGGIRATFGAEASFRFQVLCAVGSLILLCVLSPSPVWWALVSLTCALVLAAELFNTALEHVIDRLHPEQHPAIGLAKDCAAGAVLVLSFASLLVAAAMVWDVWR